MRSNKRTLSFIQFLASDSAFRERHFCDRLRRWETIKSVNFTGTGEPEKAARWEQRGGGKGMGPGEGRASIGGGRVSMRRQEGNNGVEMRASMIITILTIHKLKNSLPAPFRYQVVLFHHQLLFHHPLKCSANHVLLFANCCHQLCLSLALIFDVLRNWHFHGLD
jgi:hypothetical protein